MVQAGVGEQFYSLSRQWRAVLADILGPLRCLGWPRLINVLRRSSEEHVRNRLEASALDWHCAEHPRW